MVRASRSDNLYYCTTEINGVYIVGLYRQNGELIHTFNYPFSNEIDALNAARIAVSVFEQTIKEFK